MRKALFVLSLVFFAACGGGGGGGAGPTAPAPVPQIAGNWLGDWSTGVILVNPVMQLSQSGNLLTGSFTLLGNTFDIEGSVDSSLTMVWRAKNGGCGSLTGDGSMSTLTPSQIGGTIDLNTLGCINPDRFTGPVVWRRTSAGSMASKLGRHGKLDDLIKAMKQ